MGVLGQNGADTTAVSKNVTDDKASDIAVGASLPLQQQPGEQENATVADLRDGIDETTPRAAPVTTTNTTSRIDSVQQQHQEHNGIVETPVAAVPPSSVTTTRGGTTFQPSESQGTPDSPAGDTTTSKVAISQISNTDARTMEEEVGVHGTEPPQHDEAEYGPHRPSDPEVAAIESQPAQQQQPDLKESPEQGNDSTVSYSPPTLASQGHHRVKLYVLSENGKWDDLGTGHVQCIAPETPGESGVLLMRTEEDSSIILNSKVLGHEIYSRQGETLIMWCDPDSGADMALSFQEESGCSDIWNSICATQSAQGSSDGAGRGHDDGSGNGIGGDEDSKVSLPSIEMASLSMLADIFEQAVFHQRRSIAVQLLGPPSSLPRLLDIFVKCEDLGDEEGLSHLYQIFKGIILLNDNDIYDILFDPHNIVDYMGPFQYDPEISPRARVDHREFLRDQAKLKQVVKFEDTDILDKIHLNYRLQYVRDVVLAKILDDQSFSTIHSRVYLVSVQIVQALGKDQGFCTRLFQQMLELSRSTTPAAPAVAAEDLKDTLTLLFELCTMAKVLPIDDRNCFYELAIEKGLFTSLQQCLEYPYSHQVRLLSAEVLSTVMVHDPWLVRGHVLSEKASDYPFFQTLISRLLDDNDIGVKDQLSDIIKVLVDIGDSSGSGSGGGGGAISAAGGGVQQEQQQQQQHTPDQLLEMFYDKIVPRLGEPLMKAAAAPTGSTVSRGPVALATKVTRTSLLFHLVELFSFFSVNHKYHIKYYLVRSHLLQHVVRLLDKERDHFLLLGVVRFVRTLLGIKDNYYHKHMIKHQLFTPIMRLFCRNGRRYNLLNSAILELFQFIYQENCKDIIAHVVHHHERELQSVSYVSVMKNLLAKHEQNLELVRDQEALAAGAVVAAPVATMREQSRHRQVLEEEAYFDGSDDEDGEAEAVVGKRTRSDEVTATQSSLEALQQHYGSAAAGAAAVTRTQSRPEAATDDLVQAGDPQSDDTHNAKRQRTG